MDKFPMRNKTKQQQFFIIITSSFSLSSFYLFCFFVIFAAQLQQTAAVAAAAQHAPQQLPQHQHQQIEVAPAQFSAAGIGTPMPLAIDEYYEPGSDEQSTGRLNQFQGFYTPRPLPAGAQFTFASVWASWSAWSFCNSGVQMRVRACNTVRGFSCLGPNREVQPCEELRFHPTSGAHKQRFREAVVTPEPAVEDEATNIYRANDPWAEDRQEAMRQLTSRNSDQTAAKMPNLPPADQTPAQNDQQTEAPIAPNLAEPINVKQSGTLKQIKDSIQLAQHQFWELSGQHGHMGTVEWGGAGGATKNEKQQYNTKKQQHNKDNNEIGTEATAERQNGKNSKENSSPRALSSKTENLSPMEKDNLAKQLVDIEHRLLKTERKLEQQNEQKSPNTVPTTKSSGNGTVAAVATVTGTKAGAEKPVEDITREWWKEKHGTQQRKHIVTAGGRRQLHSDGGHKAVVEELTDSEEFVASAEEVPLKLMPSSLQSSVQAHIAKTNSGAKFESSEISGGGAMQSAVAATSAQKSANDGTIGAKSGKSVAVIMAQNNNNNNKKHWKRPGITVAEAEDNKRDGTTPATTTPIRTATTVVTTVANATDVVGVMPKHQTSALRNNNLSAHLMGRMNARQRTIVTMMEQQLQQKRKQYRKEGDDITMPSASLLLEMPKKQQQQAQKEMPRDENAKNKGQMSAESSSGRLSTDTAQALEWMLANMSKSVEDELQLQQKQQHGSATIGSSSNNRNNKLEPSSSRNVDDHGAEEQEQAADEAQNRRPSVVFPSKPLLKVHNSTGSSNNNNNGASASSSSSAAAAVVRPTLASATKSRAGGVAQFVVAKTTTTTAQHQKQQNAKNGGNNNQLNLMNSQAFAPGKPLRIGPSWDEESGEEEEEGGGGEEQNDGTVDEPNSAATSTAKAMERHRKRIITELARAQSVVLQQQQQQQQQQYQQQEEHKQASSRVSMEREIGRLRAELRTMEQQIGKMRLGEHGQHQQQQQQQDVHGEQPQQQKQDERVGGTIATMAKASGGIRKSSSSVTTGTKAEDEQHQQHNVQQQKHKQVKIPSSPFPAGGGGGAAGTASTFMEKSEKSSAKEADGEEDEDDDGGEEGSSVSNEEANKPKSALSSEKSTRGEQQKRQKSAKSYEIGPVRIGEAMVQQQPAKSAAAETATATMGRSNSQNIGNEVTTTNAENADNTVWMLDGGDGIGNRHDDKAAWTDWGPWGECICGKQMRSRVCHYEQHSNGCSGRSYEVRHCSTASSTNCPTTRPPVPPSRRNSAAGSGSGAFAVSPAAQSNGIIRLRHLLWRRSRK